MEANQLSEISWQKTVLPVSATIQQAIRSLNESSCQIVIVVSEYGAFKGTLTDGDIRRGLLNGFDLNSPIAELVHGNALVVSPGFSRESVLQLMVSNRIQQIPVLDERRSVVGLYLWDEITKPSIRHNMMVIMAGGKGTRLRPHTENCPKPLLPVSGKPMLEHIIERAKAAGFQHFVLAVHYLSHMIEEYFGNGEKWQVNIEYLRERSPLGTAGALRLLNPPPDIPFVVTNGDVLTDIRYGELLDFHVRYGATATMAVRIHEWQHPFGVVETEGVDIVGFEEKPVSRTRVNAGVYVVAPDALQYLKHEESCDMPTLFERLKHERQRTIVYPMHEPWLDVGRPEDLEKANFTNAMGS